MLKGIEAVSNCVRSNRCHQAVLEKFGHSPHGDVLLRDEKNDRGDLFQVLF